MTVLINDKMTYLTNIFSLIKAFQEKPKEAAMGVAALMLLCSLWYNYQQSEEIKEVLKDSYEQLLESRLEIDSTRRAKRDTVFFKLPTKNGK
jgi:hypothetical protein